MHGRMVQIADSLPCLQVLTGLQPPDFPYMPGSPVAAGALAVMGAFVKKVYCNP